MEAFLQKMESWVWGWPLLLLLMGTGVYLTLRLRFLPILGLGRGLRLVFRAKTEAASPGRRNRSVTPFGSLCTALSATIGTGNMVGVATALALGGPGALVWMELGGLTGLGLKFAEGALATRYREPVPGGGFRGGPFAYIRGGLGSRWRPLGWTFSLFGALAGLCGVGTLVQVGSVTACLTAFLYRISDRVTVLVLPGLQTVPLAALALGLLLSLGAGLVLLGGLGRVSRVASVLVPFMGGAYVVLCLWILIRFAPTLPGVLEEAVTLAFYPRAAGAGLMGAVTAGISRGVFSNEAGLGTAPIVAAAARGISPRDQGLLSMTATVFDTFVICTLTGLVLLVTGCREAGISAILEAFARGLPLPPALSMGLVLFFLTMFAFTTVVGWSCYGLACLEDLAGDRPLLKKTYLALYVGSVALAPLCPAGCLWTAANLCNGLMAWPNVTALLLLAPRVAECSQSED